jgi:GNAT superfamily N-acetyltransferase
MSPALEITLPSPYATGGVPAERPRAASRLARTTASRWEQVHPGQASIEGQQRGAERPGARGVEPVAQSDVLPQARARCANGAMARAQRGCAGGHADVTNRGGGRRRADQSPADVACRCWPPSAWALCVRRWTRRPDQPPDSGDRRAAHALLTDAASTARHLPAGVRGQSKRGVLAVRSPDAYAASQVDGVEVVIRTGTDADASVVAGLYMSTFTKELNAVFGRAAEEIVRRALHPDTALVACISDHIVGFAALADRERRLVQPQPSDFHDVYGPLVRRVRAWMWSRATTTPRPQQLLLEGLAIEPSARGKGVGTRLLEAVDERARDLGRTEIILEVIDANPRAKALYERHGYRTVTTVTSAWYRLAGFRSFDLMIHPVPPSPTRRTHGP